MDLAKKLARLPPPHKLHIPLEHYDTIYFPEDRTVHNMDSEFAGRSDPRSELTKLGALCQSIVGGTERKRVHEIRVSVPLPWKALLSFLIHRRTEKIVIPGRGDFDKPSPRPHDYIFCASDSESHQIIRFYSSCICKGCLLKNHRPYVLIYFPVADLPNLAALHKFVGSTAARPGANLGQKIKKERTNAYIRNFFIYVVEPHHRDCAVSVCGAALWTGVKTWIVYLHAHVFPKSATASTPEAQETIALPHQAELDSSSGRSVNSECSIDTADSGSIVKSRSKVAVEFYSMPPRAATTAAGALTGVGTDSLDAITSTEQLNSATPSVAANADSEEVCSPQPGSTRTRRKRTRPAQIRESTVVTRNSKRRKYISIPQSPEMLLADSMAVDLSSDCSSSSVTTPVNDFGPEPNEEDPSNILVDNFFASPSHLADEQWLGDSGHMQLDPRGSTDGAHNFAPASQIFTQNDFFNLSLEDCSYSDPAEAFLNDVLGPASNDTGLGH